MLRLISGALALACAASIHAAPIAGQGTWETTLQARDINNDGVIDAYYDTLTDATWLADAGYALTSNYRGPGDWFIEQGALMPGDVPAFAASANVFGVTGWRLPHAANWIPPECTFGMPYCAFIPPQGSNEMADLFYGVLGNGAGKPINTGGFLNVAGDTGLYLMQEAYSGPFANGGSLPILFRWTAAGVSFVAWEVGPTFGWLVHDGDIGSAPATALRAMVAPVPEPDSYALLALGAAVLLLHPAVAGAKRKQR